MTFLIFVIGFGLYGFYLKCFKSDLDCDWCGGTHETKDCPQFR